jgi:hypothetical protein
MTATNLSRQFWELSKKKAFSCFCLLALLSYAKRSCRSNAMSQSRPSPSVASQPQGITQFSQRRFARRFAVSNVKGTCVRPLKCCCLICNLRDLFRSCCYLLCSTLFWHQIMPIRVCSEKFSLEVAKWIEFSQDYIFLYYRQKLMSATTGSKIIIMIIFSAFLYLLSEPKTTKIKIANRLLPQTRYLSFKYYALHSFYFLRNLQKYLKISVFSWTFDRNLPLPTV